MIVRINPDVFNVEDQSAILKVLNLLLTYFDEAFLWDLDNIEELFISEEGEFVFNSRLTPGILGPQLLQMFEERIGEAYSSAIYNTTAHKRYLTRISVGNEPNEISPENALRILSQPSVLVVENGVNDGKLFKGIIENYSSFGKRKSIYALIKKAYDNGKLIVNHSGGAGGIRGIIESLKEGNYREVSHLKVIAVFDSDRSNSQSINIKYHNLLRFLKGRDFNIADPNEWTYQENDRFYWHMWYKKELENYVPLELMFATFPEIITAKQTELIAYTEEERDFYKFGVILNEGYKNITPNLFLNEGLAQALEEKCNHHKVKVELPNNTLTDVSEMEKILLMIAKII